MPDGTLRQREAQIGIGLRSPHVGDLLATRPALDFIEVHTENYVGFGPAFENLMTVRRDYGVSLHGVGLSLGSAEGIDRAHLGRFRELADRIEPMLVSEHLSWSIVDGAYLNDLLPLPYTEDSLDVVVRNVSIAQDGLARPLLVENPSRYLRFSDSHIPEAEFLSELSRRTGCMILCDVNNIYVNVVNVGEDAIRYLETLPPSAVREIHLAGHARSDIDGRGLLIDDHGAAVCDEVWALFDYAISRFGSVPSLIERDRNLPPLADLVAEADIARRVHAAAA